MKVEEIKKPENTTPFRNVAGGDVFYFAGASLVDGQHEYYVRIARVYSIAKESKFNMLLLSGDMGLRWADDSEIVVVVDAFLTVQEVQPILEMPS